MTPLLRRRPGGLSKAGVASQAVGPERRRLLGCTDLLAEPGILRARAGVRRQWALHASSPTRRIKFYDYAVDVDVPAAPAAGPVPPGRARARRTDTRRLGPADVCPGGGVPPTASGDPLLFAGKRPGGIIGLIPSRGVP